LQTTDARIAPADGCPNGAMLLATCAPGWLRNLLKGLPTSLLATSLLLTPRSPAAALNHFTALAEKRTATAWSHASSIVSAQTSAASAAEVRSSPSFDSTADGSAQSGSSASNGASLCAYADADPDTQTGIVDYRAQNSELDDDETVSSWIGLTLSRDHRQLKSGAYMSGLLVIAVEAGSPAANAGLRPPIQGKARQVVEMATLAAGMVFAPAMIGVAIVNSSQLNESDDLIIGIDGDRIVNVIEFENHLCAVRAGQIVYFNIVRNGLRLQVPVSIPPWMATPYCAMFPASSGGK
jgi:hypothetical protein